MNFLKNITKILVNFIKILVKSFLIITKRKNMHEASFMKIEQLLPFLLSSLGAFLIAAQVALIIFCKYFADTNNKFILKELKNFFIIIFSLFACVIFCGVLLWSQKNEIFYDPMKEAIIATKIAVCLLMSVNFIYMYYKFLCAKKAFVLNESLEISENITIIAFYFTPLNVVLSVLCIYLGIALRDF